MSLQIRPILAGFAVPGLLWWVTSVANGQTSPSPTGLPIPAPTSPVTYRALLLTNGTVVQGEIIEDAAAGLYRYRASGGMVPYPRSMVRKAAGSVEELYQFQADRVATNDPDDRMKLARWCLKEHLTTQARDQLVAIQAMCPADAEVKKMLFNLNANADHPRFDADLRRTSGDAGAGDAPANLDPRILGKARRQGHDLPTIFDLPPALAVKRANEFADSVQPVLQQFCVKCHNETYQGGFQLVAIRNRRDALNQDVSRVNLEATLRLVNPDDPARSELLTAGLVPHGGHRAAIFKGPSDRNYQTLVAWVKSLNPAARGVSDAVTRTGFRPTEPASTASGGFAADRSGPTPVGPRSPTPLRGVPPRSDLPPLPGADSMAGAVPVIPPFESRTTVEQYEGTADFRRSASDNPEFPAPFAVGGRPTAPLKPVAAQPKSKPVELPESTSIPQSSQPATPTGTNAVEFKATTDPNELPGMDLTRYPPKAKANPEEAQADKKKPKKLDNSLLDKVMKSRKGSSTTP